MSKKSMIYKGVSRDVATNPWMRLVRGRRYLVEKHRLPSGKVRVRIWDGTEVCREGYNSLKEFESEWS